MLLLQRQWILLSLASLLIPSVSATPIQEGLTLWLDAKDSSTLFTDLDCKKPAGRIDYVSCWKDKSEHKNKVTLILKSSRAKRQFDISNKKTVVKFNHSGFISEVPGQITANTSYTKFVVFKIDNDKGDKQKKGAPKHNLVGSDPYETTLWANNGRLHSEHHSDNYLDSKQKLNTRKYHIATTRYSKPEVPVMPNILNLDGKQEASNYNKSDHATTFTTIGSVGSPDKLGTYFYLDGKIAEALIYDKALSDIEIDEVEQYLAHKWGLKLKQNISFKAPNGTKNIDAAILLNAEASSGLPVTFTSKTTKTCTIIGEGKYIKLDAIGVCTIKATQKGNKIYPKAPTITQTFLINEN